MYKMLILIIHLNSVGFSDVVGGGTTPKTVLDSLIE